MDRFHCPRCGRVLKKSAQAAVVGQIRRDRECAFIGLGEPVKTVKCPRCGYAMECEQMLHGEYESGFTPTGGWIALVIGVAVTIALWAFGDTEWWQGAVLGFLAGALIARFWSYLELRRHAH